MTSDPSAAHHSCIPLAPLLLCISLMVLSLSFSFFFFLVAGCVRSHSHTTLPLPSCTLAGGLPPGSVAGPLLFLFSVLILSSLAPFHGFPYRDTRCPVFQSCVSNYQDALRTAEAQTDASSQISPEVFCCLLCVSADSFHGHSVQVSCHPPPFFLASLIQ